MITQPETRTCRICNEVKPSNMFVIDRRVKGGITNRCKACKFKRESKPAKAFRRFYEKQDKYPIPVETDRQEIESLFSAWDRCVYCFHTFDGTPTVDHITPLSTDGSRHHISNLLLACESCNKSKNDKPLLVFYEETPEFHEVNLQVIIKYIAYFSRVTPEEVREELQAQYDRYYEERRSVAN
ncbi:hypothetical protein ACA30_15770 [Virgibacillus soli]|nr:hypothetical protein ACA30_15770 [Virgibacillus soli]